MALRLIAPKMVVSDVMIDVVTVEQLKRSADQRASARSVVLVVRGRRRRRRVVDVDDSR